MSLISCVYVDGDVDNIMLEHCPGSIDDIVLTSTKEIEGMIEYHQNLWLMKGIVLPWFIKGFVLYNFGLFCVIVSLLGILPFNQNKA